MIDWLSRLLWVISSKNPKVNRTVLILLWLLFWEFLDYFDKSNHSVIAKNWTFNPTICNIICWFAGLLGQMTFWLSVWCSKYYFFSWFFAKIVSIFIYWNHFCKEFCKKSWKKKYLEHQMLGWQVIVPATQRTSVLYCRLSDFFYDWSAVQTALSH